MRLLSKECSRHFVTVTEARLIHLPHEASRILPFPWGSPIPSHSTRLSSVGDFCRSLSLLPRRVLPAVLTLVTCLSRLTLMPGLSSVNMASRVYHGEDTFLPTNPSLSCVSIYPQTQCLLRFISHSQRHPSEFSDWVTLETFWSHFQSRRR